MSELPTTDSVVFWFLRNVVGLPMLLILGLQLCLWTLSWALFARAARSWGESLLIVFRSRTSPMKRAFWSIVFYQVSFVVASYWLALMIQMMGDEKGWARIASGQSFEMAEVFSNALAYDHWTTLTRQTVTFTLVFLAVMNVLAWYVNGLEPAIIVLMFPALGGALLIGLVGLCVLGLAATGAPGYTYEMAWFYAIWVASLLTWSFLIWKSLSSPAVLKKLITSS